MPQNFIIGDNSHYLNKLDPNFSYQNLSGFELVAGPSLKEIVSGLPHEKYEIEKPKDNNYSPSNISRIIWGFLNSRAGKIRHSGSRPDYGFREEDYLQKIIYYVKRGMPIELFFMNFSPKFANPLISGYDILPDLSNLLAMQHLADINYSVQQIYEPGIRFVVAYEGGIYQELGGFTDEEVQETYQQIKCFSQLIEEKMGMPGVLDIVDGKELVTGINHFIGSLKKEEERLNDLYQNRDPSFVSQFDAWRNRFALNVINLDQLIRKHGLDHPPLSLNEWLQILNDSPPQDKFLKQVRDMADKAAYSMAIDYFAFSNLKYCTGRANLGIMQDYPHALSVTVRADKKRLELQLIPGNSMYPHHGVTAWNGEKWKITKLIDLAGYHGQFEGVILSGHSGRRPFCYMPKSSRCPQFAVEPFEEDFPAILSKKGYQMLEDWSHRGGMDSKIFLAQSQAGEKVVIKYSSVEGFQGNGRPVLRQEAKRLETIVASLGQQQKIFPAIIEFKDNDEMTYYVAAYFENAENAADYLAAQPDGCAYTKESEKLVARLLDMLSEKIYSIGSIAAPERYISVWHLDRLRQGLSLLTDNKSDIFPLYIEGRRFGINGAEYSDITEFFKQVFSYGRVRINGAEFMNFPALLSVIERNEGEINRRLNPKKIPRITHGDLYLGNVLINKSGELLLIDPYGRRPVNAVESELGRITLSFFADFLRNRNYSINVSLSDELRMSLYYSGSNEDLILGMSKARDNMLQMFKGHKGIYEWVRDTEDWQSHVLLIEAIHIAVVAANKFAIDPSGKLALGCYIVGTILMNNVLAGMGFIGKNEVSSPMELFLPSGRYNFQRNMFMKNFAGNEDLDYILGSLGKVEKYG